MWRWVTGSLREPRPTSATPPTSAPSSSSTCRMRTPARRPPCLTMPRKWSTTAPLWECSVPWCWVCGSSPVGAIGARRCPHCSYPRWERPRRWRGCRARGRRVRRGHPLRIRRRCRPMAQRCDRRRRRRGVVREPAGQRARVEREHRHLTRGRLQPPQREATVLLEGKVMVVSGVGPGLGREIAVAAVRDGASVMMACAPRPTSRPPRTRSTRRASVSGGRSPTSPTPSSATRLADAAVEKFRQARRARRTAPRSTPCSAACRTPTSTSGARCSTPT